MTVPLGAYSNERTYEIGLCGEEIRGPETIKIIALGERTSPPNLIPERNRTDEAIDEWTSCVDE